MLNETKEKYIGWVMQRKQIATALACCSGKRRCAIDKFRESPQACCGMTD